MNIRLLIPVFVILSVYCSCDNISTYPISQPDASLDDDRLIGKWKFEEDTNKNNFYEVYESAYPHQYHVRFWNRGGTNPTYEGNVYYSKVQGDRFLNIPYFTNPLEGHWYIFLRILDINKDGSKMTGAVVGDENMLKLQSEKEAYNYIAENKNMPEFYLDTVHLFKVK